MNRALDRGDGVSGGDVWSTPVRSAVRAIDVRWALGTALWSVGVVVSLATFVAGCVMALLDLRIEAALPVSFFAASLIGCFGVLLTRLPQVDSQRTIHALVVIVVHNALIALIGVMSVVLYTVVAADPSTDTYSRIALAWAGSGVASVVGMLLANANIPDAGALPSGTQVGAIDGDHIL